MRPRKTLTEQLQEMKARKAQQEGTPQAVEPTKSKNVKKGVFTIEMPSVPPQKVKDYKVITTAAELIAYLKRCEATGMCGFDYETTISDEYRAKCMSKRGHILQLDVEDKERSKLLKEWEEDFLKAPLDPWKAEICTVSLSAAQHEARVVFIDNPGNNRYLPIGKNVRQEVFDLLDEHLFRNPNIVKIAVNLSFETKHTLKLGKYILNPVADALIMWVRCMQIMAPEEILEPSFPVAGLGLKEMTKKVFNVTMSEHGLTPEQIEQAGGNTFTALLQKHGVQFFSEISADHQDALVYSAEDADYSVQQYLYWREIAKQIPKYDTWLHEIEMPFTRVIGTMEYWGMNWDNDLANKKLEEAEKERDKALREIEAIGEQFGCQFKINKTPKTLAVQNLLFNVLKAPVSKLSKKTSNVSLDNEALIDLRFMAENKLEDLSEEELLSVDESYSSFKRNAKAKLDARPENPNKAVILHLIDLLQKVQKATTLISSHILGRQKYLNPVTGRIHASYHQWTDTGRLGSRSPNAQNTPAPANDRLGVRNFYKAEEGKVMFLIDFSGFELRLMAWKSGDEAMTHEFVHGKGDLHRVTAATIAGKKPDEVTKAERNKAKAPNFLISYMGTEHALQKNLKTKFDKRETLEECKKLIDAVYATYPRIQPFQREATLFAREHGYSETIYGFKRLLSYIKSTNNKLRQDDERRASNTPIQGSAADIMKRCQNETYDLIANDDEYRKHVRLIAQIHDEQIMEVTEDISIIKRLVADVKRIMERPPLPDFPIPIVAEASIAVRWGQKMDYDAYLQTK